MTALVFAPPATNGTLVFAAISNGALVFAPAPAKGALTFPTPSPPQSLNQPAPGRTLLFTAPAPPVSLSQPAAAGGTLVVSVTGPRGAPGQAGSLGAYRHVQTTAAASWTVAHNLGTTSPSSVTLWSGGQLVDTDVLTADANTLLVIWAAPTAGLAFVLP